MFFYSFNHSNNLNKYNYRIRIYYINFHKGDIMSLSKSKTVENLKAFAGESQANRHYLYFASKLM